MDRVGQVAELGLDGRAAGVRGGHELRHRGDGLVVGEAARVHHHGVEPCVEAAQRLLERVGLVEEQGDRHAGPAGNLAAEGAEQLDPAAVEPGLMPEEAAGADDHRRPLGLRGLDDGLERVAVPGLEVPERVPVRAGVREQGRQRGEGHFSRKASASARVKSPAVQPSLVHAEAPITLPNSRQRRRSQPWSSP